MINTPYVAGAVLQAFSSFIIIDLLREANQGKQISFCLGFFIQMVLTPLIPLPPLPFHRENSYVERIYLMAGRIVGKEMTDKCKNYTG